MLLNKRKEKNHHLNVVESFVSPTVLGTMASVPSGLFEGRVVSGYGPERDSGTSPCSQAWEGGRRAFCGWGFQQKLETKV